MINNIKMKIYLAADHGGYDLKEKLKIFLAELGNETVDVGVHNPNPGDDYPDFIIPAAEEISIQCSQNNDCLGIVLGRSGNGEAIAANKVKGIRAAVCLNVQMAKKARDHNNANVLAIGADYVSDDEAKEIVKTFVETPFSEAERHVRRLQKITDYESK
jgi:ribose 5-phosphate isomerase B